MLRFVKFACKLSLKMSGSKDGLDFYERDLKRIEVLKDVPTPVRTPHLQLRPRQPGDGAATVAAG